MMNDMYSKFGICAKTLMLLWLFSAGIYLIILFIRDHNAKKFNRRFGIIYDEVTVITFIIILALYVMRSIFAVILQLHFTSFLNNFGMICLMIMLIVVMIIDAENLKGRKLSKELRKYVVKVVKKFKKTK